ncbi:MAG: hypothetical protein ACE141_06040 [Bryobacteraceae bacterium]
MDASERVRVVHQDGIVGASVDPDVARQWISQGHAVRIGSNRKLRCVRLTGPLPDLAGSEAPGRASTASRLGVHFTERERFGGRPVFKHKDYLRKRWNRDCCQAVLASVMVGAPGE